MGCIPFWPNAGPADSLTNYYPPLHPLILLALFHFLFSSCSYKCLSSCALIFRLLWFYTVRILWDFRGIHGVAVAKDRGESWSWSWSTCTIGLSNIDTDMRVCVCVWGGACVLVIEFIVWHSKYRWVNYAGKLVSKYLRAVYCITQVDDAPRPARPSSNRTQKGNAIYMLMWQPDCVYRKRYIISLRFPECKKKGWERGRREWDLPIYWKINSWKMICWSVSWTSVSIRQA